MAKKKTSSKKKTGPGPGFKGYTGTTTGKTVAEYWAKLFAAQPKAKLDNKGLSGEMAIEFPNAKKYSDRDVIVFRNRYNNGNLVHQTEAPKIRIGEYVSCPSCGHGVRVKGWGEKKRAQIETKKPAKVTKKVTKKKASKKSPKKGATPRFSTKPKIAKKKATKKKTGKS